MAAIVLQTPEVVGDCHQAGEQLMLCRSGVTAYHCVPPRNCREPPQVTQVIFRVGIREPRI